MPRIIDDDLFFRAQNLLDKNKSAPGRTHGKGEYLLTTKFFCSQCNAPMTGFCGTSHTQRVYPYYICSNAKIKKCNSVMVSKQIIEDTVIGACIAFLNHDTIEHIADSIYRACQDDSNIASIKKLNVRLVEIEQAIENLWNALELGDAAERITKRINAREEEKAEIERQLAIERRKIKSFDYPRIHAFLEQMKGLNCGNIHDRSKLATMFIHTIFYYNDYLIIIMNGGKGLVTAENIPLKSIENSLNIDIPGTFSGSSVCQPAPPNFTIRTIRHHGHHGWRPLRIQCKDIADRTVIETVRSSVFFMHRNSRIFSFYLRCLSCWLHDTLFAETCRKEGDTVKKVMLLASEDMCEILRAALDDKYIILPCSDPAACSELLKMEPDVLILDMFLPGTDGMAFLKAHAADLPPAVMAVSRFFSDELLQELEALGVSSVILIPCTLSYLRDQLAKH